MKIKTTPKPQTASPSARQTRPANKQAAPDTFVSGGEHSTPAHGPAATGGHGTAALRAAQQNLHGLAEAKPAQVVRLEDGDRFPMAMKLVKKTINGVTIRGYSYNGSIPGPIIEVPQGATIRVPFRNNTDFENTLHSHGVHGDFTMDGMPDRPHPAVKPGEVFDYELSFPDAGVFWYHPHVSDWYARELGAAGVFVVKPKDPEYYNPVNREEVLVLDDIEIIDGEAGVGTPDNPSHVLMGRFGNTMLTNGETDYRLDVKQGEVVRFHLVNTADVRPFNFSIDNAKIKVIGSDVGRSEREEWADSVLISPAERYTVEVLFDSPGDHSIVNRTPDGTRTELGKVSVAHEKADALYHDAFHRLRENGDVIESIDRFRPFFDKPADRALVMTLDMNMDHGDGMSGAGTMPGMDGHAMPMGTEPAMPAMDGHEMPMGTEPAMTGDATSTAGAGMPGMAGHTTPAVGGEGPMSSMAGAGRATGGHATPAMPAAPAPAMVGHAPAEHSMPGSVATAMGALPLHARTGGIEWEDGMARMNDMSNLENVVWKLVDPKTGATNMDIDWDFEQGVPAMVELYNDPSSAHPMQHPIHFHGMPFLVVSIDGESNPNLAWKDTVLVRPGERVKILLDTFNPGDWMFHCHISRHSAGHRMMGLFSVNDGPQAHPASE